MKRFICLFGFLALAGLFLYSCDNDDDEDGKDAQYQVTITQTGEFESYIKGVVISAPGATLKDDITGQEITKTVFSDEDFTGNVFSVSTVGHCREFAVSGGVVDGEDLEENLPMYWKVVVKKNGKEIDNLTLEFKDGHMPSTEDLNLYYK